LHSSEIAGFAYPRRNTQVIAFQELRTDPFPETNRRFRRNRHDPDHSTDTADRQIKRYPDS
jgi:hypothetical protein